MARRGKAVYEPPIFTFRVRMLDGAYAPVNCREIWREIQIAGNQPVWMMGEAIPLAFDFDNDHMWSFFLSGKAWDTSTEYGMGDDSEGLFSFGRSSTKKSKIDTPVRELPLPGVKGTKEFLFLFDYGDNWEFGVKLVRKSDEIEPRARYPRLMSSHGEAPPQYPSFDEEDEGDGEDESPGSTQGQALPRMDIVTPVRGES